MVKLKNKAFAGGSVMDVTTNPRSLPTGRSTYLDIGLGNEFFVNELSPSKKTNRIRPTIEGITPDKETGYHG